MPPPRASTCPKGTDRSTCPVAGIWYCAVASMVDSSGSLKHVSTCMSLYMVVVAFLVRSHASNCDMWLGLVAASTVACHGTCTRACAVLLLVSRGLRGMHVATIVKEHEVPDCLQSGHVELISCVMTQTAAASARATVQQCVIR